MKLLTANFLTCAVKSCKASPAAFPLHFRDAELQRQDMEYNPAFLRNVLPRVEWDALRSMAEELGFTSLPPTKPEPSSIPTTSAPYGNEPSQPALEASDASEAGPMDISTSPPPLTPQASATPSGPTAEPTAETTNRTTTQATATSAADHSLADAPDEKLWRELHELLLETQVVEGRLVCGNCGHEYRIKEGIANFLLPNHLV